MTYKLDALLATTAWHNAALATGGDASRPALHKTLVIECFEEGLQFVATNGHALFRTWVPFKDAKRVEIPWPSDSTRPARTVIVRDIDGFGKAFMKTLAVAGKEGSEVLELQVGLQNPFDAPALSEALSGRILTLRAMGQRLDLTLMDDTFPDWRRLRLGVDDVERVEGIAVGPKLVKLLAQLKGVRKLDLDFTGTERAILFVATGDSETRGVIMPMLREKEKEKGKDRSDEDGEDY